MSSDEKCFTITWKIENFSFLYSYLWSPTFTAYTIKRTRWRIQLGAFSDSINFLLTREKNNTCPEVEYEFSLITCDGSCPRSTERSREKGVNEWKSITIDPMRDKTILWLEDILTVRCRIWRTDKALREAKYCFVRTGLKGRRIAFFKDIQKFSGVRPEEEIALSCVSSVAQERRDSVTVYISRNGEILLNVISSTLLFNCEVYLSTALGNREECGRFMYGVNNSNLTLKFTKGELLKEKHIYLPNDTLTLICEVVRWDGIEAEGIDASTQSSPSDTYNDQNSKISKISEERSEMPSHLKNKILNISNATDVLGANVKSHLVSVYEEKILCNAKIRTNTDTFSAHKLILSRSPVFKAMFTHDMKENQTDCIDITDLNSETVRQMLYFMYTDSLEDLNWEKAKDLYFASDKYEIFPLKQKCSTYLTNNLQTSNCCEVLVLADMHQDGDLKNFVQDFILRNEEEVYGSEEWKVLMKNHTYLAADTMHLKYRKK